MARILTLGMAVLDHIFRLRNFPEAGEKYRAEGYVTQVGGPATMAAVAIARLGGTSHLCTRLGGDANSHAIMAELDKAGVDWSPSQIVPDAIAPVSSVYLDGDGERQIVNFRGKGLPVSPAAIPDNHLDGIDAVLVDPRWPQGAAHLAALARARNIPVIVDAENDLDALDETMKNATHIAFSTQGLRTLTGQTDIVSGLKLAAERYDAWLGVTQGDKGVIYLEEGAVAHAAAFPVEAIDTLGAGDVWHGAFALAIGEGRSAFGAARFANAAAALKCRNGTGWAALPSREDVLGLMAGTVN